MSGADPIGYNRGMESVRELLLELAELFTSEDSPIKKAIDPLGDGAVLKVHAPGGSICVEKVGGRFVYGESTEKRSLFELVFEDPRDLETFREVKDARDFGDRFLTLVREGRLKLDMLRPFIDLWSLGVGYFLEEIGILSPPHDYQDLIGSLQLRDIAFTEILDVRYLQELVDELARITGVRLWVLDMNCMPVVVSATGGEHCKLIIDSLEGVMRCYRSAIGALAELKKSMGPKVRICHAGFVCFDAPLILGGEIVGMISGDASLMETPDLEKYRRLAEELSVDPEPLLASLEHVRSVNIEEVEFLLSVVNAIAQVVTEMSFKQYLLTRQMKENAELTRELRRANMELKALFQSILEIQERERSSVARDLHDHTGQDLSNALVNLELALSEEGVPEGTRAHIESASSSISQVLKQVHDLSASLHPPVLDDLGLAEALRNLVRRMNADYPIEFSLHTEGEEGALSGEVKINLYRIAQEALNNVVRHSGARRARVELRRDEKGLELVISDDGRGFADAGRAGRDRPSSCEGENAIHLGLVNMRERAERIGATLEFPPRERGVTVAVRIPAAP
ncbi:MAG: PocR ligand-binding domain-containing protein [Actinobacteria bacterium]|nr:PocR ligand-binding domain-containing protein [Actinomycetota bacterium]